MINIKFINATSVQLKDQDGNTVQNMGEFVSPTEYSYSGNTFSKSQINYYHFEVEGTNVQLSGTIGDVTEAYQYWNLFKGQSAITDASNLTLSSAITKQFCYSNMFMDCSNLTSAPTISATTLAEWCYQGMFAGCTSLTSAPALVATTLAPYCYFAMFYGCISLSSGPFLPATTLANWSYGSMFFNCENLTSISSNFNSWSPSSATKYWVTGIETIGDFYNPNISLIFGNDNIPQNWKPKPLTFVAKSDSNIKLNQTGSPDTILLDYKLNDGEWTAYSIGEQIDLNSGDTVAFSGANNHFSKDSDNFYRFRMTGSIEADGNIQSLMNWSNSCTSACYNYLFYGCSSLTKVPQLPATILANKCYSVMFYGCTSLTEVPVDLLPATTLSEGCYASMFIFCNNLTNAPTLPATTLAPSCYLSMFDSCFKLNSVSVDFTNWNDSNYSTSNWLNHVASNGTFTCPTELPLSTGVNYIPEGWNVTNK